MSRNTFVVNPNIPVSQEVHFNNMQNEDIVAVHQKNWFPLSLTKKLLHLKKKKEKVINFLLH